MDWSFNVQCYDAGGAKTDIVPVLMTSVSKGHIVNGNDVEVKGRFDGRGVFRAHQIKNLSTRATIKPAMGEGAEAVGNVIKYLLAAAFLVVFLTLGYTVISNILAAQKRFGQMPSFPTGPAYPTGPSNIAAPPDNKVVPGATYDSGTLPPVVVQTNAQDAKAQQNLENALAACPSAGPNAAACKMRAYDAWDQTNHAIEASHQKAP